MSFLDHFRRKATTTETKGLSNNVSHSSTFGLGGGFHGASIGGTFVTSGEYYASLAFRLADIPASAVASLNPQVVARNGGPLPNWHMAINRALLRPCSLMSAFDFWRLLVHRQYADGAAYAVIVRDGSSRLREFLPIPAPVRLADRQGGVWWSIATAMGDDILGPRLRDAGFGATVSDSDLLILRGPPLIGGNGLASVSTLKNATAQVALESALTEFAADVHRNGGRPSLYMALQGKISPEASERAQKAFRHFFGRGGANHNGMMILPEGAKLEPLSANAVDSETMANREFQVVELARRYGIPPTMAGVVSAVPRGTAEAETRAFYDNCLRALLESIESALEDRIIAGEDLTAYGVEFDVSGLLRADTSARADFILKLRTAGVVSPNEARAWESLPPVEGGEDLRAPLNSNVSDKRGRPPGDGTGHDPA